jgi:hypothetical protein
MTRDKYVVHTALVIYTVHQLDRELRTMSLYDLVLVVLEKASSNCSYNYQRRLIRTMVRAPQPMMRRGTDDFMNSTRIFK